MWDSLFDMAVSIANQFEILPTIPRRTGRQINRAGHPADNQRETKRDTTEMKQDRAETKRNEARHNRNEAKRDTIEMKRSETQ